MSRRDAGASRPQRVQPARRIAYEVLQAVRESDAYANLLLPALLGRAGLPERDAGLATELAYGTLRLRGYYDAVIALAARRPVNRIDPEVLDVLRLACHQLLSLRVAPHAAVDEAVSQVRAVAHSAAGFVNGVLRSIARTDPDTWRVRVAAAARTPDDALAALHSHPVWIVRAFREALEAEGRGGELEELLAADNLAPRVGLVALPGLASPGELDRTTPGRWSPLAAIADGGDPAALPAVAEGRARVQDEGSQLAALALSRARPVEAGERWLDLCAGPGGKAALLAAEAAGGGATLLANEAAPARAELVRQALAGLPAVVAEGDGRRIGRQHPESFDRILVDAPCTGLGALRRRPEARWRKSPRDVAELSRLQQELLESAAAALKPGGLLAYVTCSPHPAETRQAVDELLGGHPELSRTDTAGVIRGISREKPDLPGAADRVQLWPHRHGTDAMFISLLQKGR